MKLILNKEWKKHQMCIKIKVQKCVDVIKNFIFDG